MENLFTPLKSVLVTALCAVLAFFAPIANLIFAVFIIFLLNCIAGIIADVVTDRKQFDLKKFFHCLLETMVFYMIIMAVYVIGDKLLNIAGAIQCSTVIVYAILYFYGTNILRNCIKLFPDSKTLKFLRPVIRDHQEPAVYGAFQGEGGRSDRGTQGRGRNRNRCGTGR